MIVRDTCWDGKFAFFHNIFYFMVSLHAFTVAHCGQPVPSLSWPFTACTLRVMRVRSVCGHGERYDFTTQARLIYVGKALRAPTESEECGED